MKMTNVIDITIKALPNIHRVQGKEKLEIYEDLETQAKKTIASKYYNKIYNDEKEYLYMNQSIKHAESRSININEDDINDIIVKSAEDIENKDKQAAFEKLSNTISEFKDDNLYHRKFIEKMSERTLTKDFKELFPSLHPSKYKIKENFNLFSWIGNIFKKAWEAIVDAINKALKAIIDVILDVIQYALEWIMEKISSALGFIIKYCVSPLLELLATLLPLLGTIFSQLMNVMSGVFSSIKDTLVIGGKAFTFIGSGMTDIFNKLIGKSGITAVLGDALTSITTGLSSLWGGFTNKIMSMFPSIAGIYDTLVMCMSMEFWKTVMHEVFLLVIAMTLVSLTFIYLIIMWFVVNPDGAYHPNTPLDYILVDKNHQEKLKWKLRSWGDKIETNITDKIEKDTNKRIHEINQKLYDQVLSEQQKEREQLIEKHIKTTERKIDEENKKRKERIINRLNELTDDLSDSDG